MLGGIEVGPKQPSTSQDLRRTVRCPTQAHEVGIAVSLPDPLQSRLPDETVDLDGRAARSDSFQSQHTFAPVGWEVDPQNNALWRCWDGLTWTSNVNGPVGTWHTCERPSPAPRTVGPVTDPRPMTPLSERRGLPAMRLRGDHLAIRGEASRAGADLRHWQTRLLQC